MGIVYMCTTIQLKSRKRRAWEISSWCLWFMPYSEWRTAGFMAGARDAMRVKEASSVCANARAKAVSAFIVPFTPADLAWYNPPFCRWKAGVVRPCQTKTMLSCLHMQTGVSLLPLLLTFQSPGSRGPGTWLLGSCLVIAHALAAFISLLAPSADIAFSPTQLTHWIEENATRYNQKQPTSLTMKLNTILLALVAFLAAHAYAAAMPHLSTTREYPVTFIEPETRN